MKILLKKPQEHFLKITMLLWFVFFSQNTWSQNLTQTIRGNITDAFTHNPLEGATVFIASLDKGESTDLNGRFRLKEIPVGRYQLQISFLGYETLILSEILLESGKELVLEIDLIPTTSSLKEVVVKTTLPDRRDKIFPTAEILTIEETLRLPATFYDPARLALSYAGVVGNNDQANHMIIRGNSPNNMSWRLEGVEIVNPNHTNNAGTESDRPSQNGGGVNILSAQLLGNSTFMRGAFPVAYGNVLSGVMDMNFRKGNNEIHEFTGQVGVVGVELAAEGPLTKKSTSSYLANYRYSTLGLLGAAGVDLGDESINYQDFAMHIAIPMGSGRLSFFGFGGSSENIFEAKEVADWEFEKDQFNIDFTSKMGAAGVKVFYPINDKWNGNLAAVFSYSNTNRTTSKYIPIDTTSFLFQPYDVDDLDQQKISINTFFKNRIGKNNQLKIGILNTWLSDKKILFSRVQNQQISGGSMEGTLIQPYIDWDAEWNDLEFNIGLRSVFFTFNNTSSIEPRASLKWNFKDENSLGIAYGLQSQRQLPQIHFNAGELLGNEDLGLTKAHHLSLIYENIKNVNLRFRVEAYYQYLFDVPIARDVENSFSALNVFENTVNLPLSNDGTGKNYGIEFSAQQYFYNNIFWIGNVSIYESKYKGSDGIERDTRFNGNYIVNASFGKEFPYSKKGKDYIFGVNIHANYSGGLRTTPIDEAASMNLNLTIFNEAEAFSLKQGNYFKTDLRIYWKRNKKRFNSTLALDIQNVTNRKNPSFQYYDNFLGRVEQKTQLGLIPILSYRIEF